MSCFSWLFRPKPKCKDEFGKHTAERECLSPPPYMDTAEPEIKVENRQRVKSYLLPRAKVTPKLCQEIERKFGEKINAIRGRSAGRPHWICDIDDRFTLNDFFLSFQEREETDPSSSIVFNLRNERVVE